MPHQISAEMRQCIQECTECRNYCLETLAHCLLLGGKHADPRHIGLLLDCAEICSLSASYMLRGSELHGQACGVCAEVCEHCAEDCERMADGGQQMLLCAQVCRRCAQVCREMAA